MLLKWTQDRTPSILFGNSNPYFAGKLTKLVCLHTSLSLSRPNRLLSSIPFSVVPACNLIIACRSRLLLSPHYNPRPTHLYGNNSYPSAAKLWRVFYLASTTNIEKTTSLGCCKKARLTQSRTFFYRFKDAIIREIPVIPLSTGLWLFFCRNISFDKHCNGIGEGNPLRIVVPQSQMVSWWALGNKEVF